MRKFPQLSPNCFNIRAALGKVTASSILISAALVSHAVPQAAAPQPISSALAAVELPVAQPSNEDLTTLSLAGKPLTATEPFLVQRDENPNFTREFFRMNWRSSDPIDVYVIRPLHVARPPVTIFLYGFPTDTDRFRNDEFCKLVTSRGYAAVGFVSALTGERFHGRGLDEWFVSDLPEALVTSVHDVQMILKYLETRKDLDTSRVGMFGQGSGGSIAILTASVEPRLKRIELMDPWGDWPHWLADSKLILDEERPRLNTKAFIESVAHLDPVDFLPKLNPASVHLQDVLYDQDTPSPARLKIENAMPHGAAVATYATPAEFQAVAANGSRLLEWIQPEADSAVPKSALEHAPMTTNAAASSIN